MKIATQSVELFLKDMAFAVRLGCSDEERSFPQVVEFDIGVHLGTGESYKEDSISSTIDYLDVSRAIEKLVSECEWKLLEKLCRDCALEVLSLSEKVQAVRVKATKRRIAHIRGVSCEVSLSKV